MGHRNTASVPGMKYLEPAVHWYFDVESLHLITVQLVATGIEYWYGHFVLVQFDVSAPRSA
jgi:hypothetical protein